MHSVANDSKWLELRKAILDLDRKPQFRIKNLNGDVYGWDGEWYYHFLGDGSFKTVEWCEIRIKNEEDETKMREILEGIGFAGSYANLIFKVYGFVADTGTISKF